LEKEMEWRMKVDIGFFRDLKRFLKDFELFLEF
jgi:hypothetical protein